MADIEKMRKNLNKKNTIFLITKSSNKNIVIYDFIDNNISYYWLMHEKDDITPPSEDVTLLERNLAYGINIINNDSDSIEFNLNGYPGIKLILDKKYGRVKYKNLDLIGIHVTLKNTFFVDTVEYVTVICETDGQISEFKVTS